jgi:dienelactone hydrolase
MNRTHEIVLFHSAQGLRPAVRSWADRLRAAGHRVHTPDLFDGEVFDQLADGVRKRDALGIPELIRRAQAAVAELPSSLVCAGFSMGAASAEFLAATRPGATAAILMHGALDPGAVGAETWPRVPVAVHYAKGDSWVDTEQVRSLERAVQASGAAVATHVYEGGGHLFADEASPDYDRASAELMFERTLAFLKTL